jgi:hypothetical protein
MEEAMNIFRLSGMKYPIHILASTFSTVSDETETIPLYPILSISVRNIEFDPTGETGIEFSPLPKGVGLDLNCQLEI